MDSVPVTIDLRRSERELLLRGALQFCDGPAPSLPPALLAWLGFESQVQLIEFVDLLEEALLPDRHISANQLSTAVKLVEVAFISDAYGCGPEWETVTGIDDNAALSTLRELQIRLPLVDR